MLVILTELNFRIVEKEWWIGGCIFLSGENNFLCLSSSIGLNNIFHWYAQPCIFTRLLLSVEIETFTQFTMLNKEVSSFKSLTSKLSPCGTLLIWMRKNKVPNTDPYGTPALINYNLEDWPFKTSLWRLLLSNDSINWRAFSFIPLFLSFYQTLPNTFYKSKKRFALLEKDWRQEHDKNYDSLTH